MLGGRLDEAERRADFILSVGEAPSAHVALSALARYHGNDFGASLHMEKAKLPSAELHFYGFLAACGTGANDEAREHLAKLRDHNVSLAEYAARQVDAARGKK
jgi:hypothetical protein